MTRKSTLSEDHWKVGIPRHLGKNLDNLNARTQGECRRKIERFKSMLNNRGAQDRVIVRLKLASKTFKADGLTFHDLPIVEGTMHCRVHI